MIEFTNQSRTIKYRVSLHGISLQTGKPVTITLCPSYTHGITFYVNGNEIIPCSVSSIMDTTLSTNIGIDHISIYTIEHLMSALHAYGIDCLDIIVDGDGIPILDGSSIHFCHLIETAGIDDIDIQKKYIKIRKMISINTTNHGSIIALPYNGFKVSMEIDFKHPMIGSQSFTFDHNINYIKDVAPARTFITMDTANYLMNNGSIQGGSINSAILLDNHSVVNTKLKWADEFVRHKVLDFLGDIYMNGPIKGYFICKCTGHKTHNELLREIVK